MKSVVESNPPFALSFTTISRISGWCLDRVFADADELSRLYTSKFLSRSLDLAHVAAARVATCTTFVSADDRQLAVAKAPGLAVVDIKRRVQRAKR